MHHPISLQGKWLRQVLRGYFAYRAVPTNCQSMSSFRHYVTDLWCRALQRRSQRDGSTWKRMAQLAAEFLPLPHILHPWPSERFAVGSPRWEPGRWIRGHRDLWGCPVMGIPTAIRTARLTWPSGPQRVSSGTPERQKTEALCQFDGSQIPRPVLASKAPT